LGRLNPRRSAPKKGVLILIIGHHSAARVVHYLRIYNSADKASYRCLTGEKSPKKSWNLSLDPAHLKSGNCHLNQLQLPAESSMVSPRYLFCARPSQQLIQRMPRECSLLRNGTVVSNAQGSTAQTRRHYFALNCGWPSPFPTFGCQKYPVDPIVDPTPCLAAIIPVQPS